MIAMPPFQICGMSHGSVSYPQRLQQSMTWKRRAPTIPPTTAGVATA